MKHRSGIKIGDVLLMSVILLTALLLFILPFFKERQLTAEISFAATGEVRTVSLAKDATYEIESRGVHLSVRVENGEIFVSESDCRDGICRGTHPISRAGQSIVCLPAGIVIRVLGDGEVIDGVSG